MKPNYFKSLTALLLAGAIFTGCDPDDPGFTVVDETFGVTIAEGTITSPQWLADAVEGVADKYPTPPVGERWYPWVYGVEYNDQKYIHVCDGLSGKGVDHDLYFTLSGESLVSTNDFWWDLITTRRGQGETTLIWRYKFLGERK